MTTDVLGALFALVREPDIFDNTRIDDDTIDLLMVSFSVVIFVPALIGIVIWSRRIQ